MSDWNTSFTDREDPIAALALPADVARSFGPARAEIVRDFVLEIARERGSVTTEIEGPTPSADAMDMMVPRTRWHVRLSRPTKDEITEFLVLAGVLHATLGDWKKASAAALKSLFDRISSLRAEYGERSVVDAIADLDVPTAAAIAARLAGRTCPRPTANCRLMTTGTLCAITEQQVMQVLTDLTARGIVKPRSGREPPEYGIVL